MCEVAMNVTFFDLGTRTQPEQPRLAIPTWGFVRFATPPLAEATQGGTGCRILSGAFPCWRVGGFLRFAYNPRRSCLLGNARGGCCVERYLRCVRNGGFAGGMGMNENDAWALYYREYAHQLSRYALARVGNRYDAEDIVADAFVRARPNILTGLTAIPPICSQSPATWSTTSPNGLGVRRSAQTPLRRPRVRASWGLKTTRSGPPCWPRIRRRSGTPSHSSQPTNVKHLNCATRGAGLCCDRNRRPVWEATAADSRADRSGA